MTALIPVYSPPPTRKFHIERLHRAPKRFGIAQTQGEQPRPLEAFLEHCAVVHSPDQQAEITEELRVHPGIACQQQTIVVFTVAAYFTPQSFHTEISNEAEQSGATVKDSPMPAGSGNALTD